MPFEGFHHILCKIAGCTGIAVVCELYFMFHACINT